MAEQATLSRFSDSSVNPDMIAVFPNGLPNLNGNNKTLGERCWEGAPYCCNGQAYDRYDCKSLVSDKQFVTDLISYMTKTYEIQNNQIFATGKSIGGGLVELLACSASHGGDFAAFAMDAGAMYTEAEPKPYCAPARKPLPILEFHGTVDTVAPYGGGQSRRGDVLPNVRSVLTTWAKRNGCSANKIPVIDHEIVDPNNPIYPYYYTEYGCNVFGYNVTGQGHWWISTEANEENKGTTLAPIDASHIMLDFFRKNPKPLSSVTKEKASQKKLEL